jgi:hypothetical protein
MWQPPAPFDNHLVLPVETTTSLRKTAATFDNYAGRYDANSSSARSSHTSIAGFYKYNC